MQIEAQENICMFCFNKCEQYMSIASSDNGDLNANEISSTHFLLEFKPTGRVMCMKCFNTNANFNESYLTIHTDNINESIYSTFQTEIDDFNFNNSSYNLNQTDSLNILSNFVFINENYLNYDESYMNQFQEMNENNQSTFYYESYDHNNASLYNSKNCSINESSFSNNSVSEPPLKKIKLNTEGFEFSYCDKRYNCNECTKSYLHLKNLKTHILEYHQKMQSAYECEICKKDFQNKYAFEKHNNNVHSHSTSQTVVECKECGQFYKNENCLKIHTKTKHVKDDIVYKCIICGKIFRTKFSLNTHNHYAHSQKSFKCNLCDKSFKTNIYLKNHMASHTGAKLYSCEFCSAAFKQSSSLYRHRMKIHEIE